MEAAVQLNNLTKVYGKNKVKAVTDVSLSINKGELFGLIGPDGAGKTSIFRMLTTLLLPDGGSATVDGCDVVTDYKAIRNKVGYMPGKFSLYQDLSVEENLDFFASLFRTSVEENHDLIKDIYVQIEPFKKRPAGKLSGGMKQKLALCCALIHKPTVLFLDEPTTGVDAVSRKEFWEILKKLKAQNITIVVSTPYMDEATLCDRIALIQKGKLLSVDTPAKIIASFPEKLYAIRSEKMYRLLKRLEAYEFTRSSYAFGENAHAIFTDEIDTEKLIAFLGQIGLENIEVKTVTPTIEDIFIYLLNSSDDT